MATRKIEGQVSDLVTEDRMSAVTFFPKSSMYPPSATYSPATLVIGETAYTASEVLEMLDDAEMVAKILCELPAKESSVAARAAKQNFDKIRSRHGLTPSSK